MYLANIVFIIRYMGVVQLWIIGISYLQVSIDDSSSYFTSKRIEQLAVVVPLIYLAICAVMFLWLQVATDKLI